MKINQELRKKREYSLLYLLQHCYEEQSLGDGTYNFITSGFKEAEILKELLEEHYKLLEEVEKLQQLLKDMKSLEE